MVRIFITAILILVYLTVHPQVIRKNAPLLQIESGICFSSFTNTGTEFERYNIHTSFLPRFYGGISLSVPVYKNLSLKSGLFYEQKGGKAYYKGTIPIDYSFLDADDMNIDYTLQMYNDYISIPIGLSYSLHHKVNFSFQVGCHIDFLLKSTYYYYLNESYTKNTEQGALISWFQICSIESKSELTRKFDFGPYIGVSLGYEFSKGIGILFTSKCEFGLLNIDSVNHNEHAWANTSIGDRFITYDYYDLSSESKSININCGLQLYFVL